MVCGSERRNDLREGYAKHPISGFAGFMTYRYCRLYLKHFYDVKMMSSSSLDDLKRYDQDNFLLDFVIRAENLEDDLITALRAIGFDLSAGQLAIIHGLERTNVTNHKPKEYYYDDETIDLVHQRERFIIEKHGYAFNE
jgi:hypothetical protein